MKNQLMRKVAIAEPGNSRALSADPKQGYVRASLLSIASLPLIVGVVTTLSFLLTLNAVAENGDRSDEFKRRFYLGLSAGVSDLDPESKTPALTVGDDRGTGGAITLGYDLSKRFAVEGYYADLGEAGIDFLGDEVGAVDYQTYGLNLLGYVFNSRGGQGLRHREGLSGFLKVGVGGILNDSELDYEQDYSNHVSFGGGLEYAWANGLGARAELTSYDTDAHFLSVGIVKRFGRASKSASRTVDNTPIQSTDSSTTPLPTTQQSIDSPVDAKSIADLPKAYFAFDKATLTSLARDKLDVVAVQMLADPGILLTIEGHADAVGSEAYNLDLSRRRAEAAKQYLIDAGIDVSRINTEAYGENAPEASNVDQTGRALNRRVQFVLN